MPIYEYLCQECGVLEVTQKITDNPLERCPSCKRKIKRLISNTSFQLKGTGWYVTDYGRKGQAGGKADGHAKSDGNAGTGSDSGKSSSEGKPAEGKPAKEKSSESTAS